MDLFRIHGDNVVECERIVNLLISETQPEKADCTLASPSTIRYHLSFHYEGQSHEWQLDLLPGFNKGNRKRWQGDIFNPLRKNGSFLDETPDAIVTEVNGSTETILYALEFCSALQAGNQAWQRNGRAFSTGRAQCPYLYIVDFVRHELNSKTRDPKSLRFPNPAVPYSYINYSMKTGTFIAQVYSRSEEFDKKQDKKLSSFDEDSFSKKELSVYLVRKMCGLDTTDIEKRILQKDLKVVSFLTYRLDNSNNFSEKDWTVIYEGKRNIIEYSISNNRFPFRKTIAEKSHHGQSAKIQNKVEELSTGFASKDLPFGIIPAAKRPLFADYLKEVYPDFDSEIISCIAESEKNLILCMLKGFKPKGDDNRPDRGLLPLISMLSNESTQVMTYIYGPVIEKNYNLLISPSQSDQKKLADGNGLWKSILSLSDFIALDAPIISISHKTTGTQYLINNQDLKTQYLKTAAKSVSSLTSSIFPNIPEEYQEDDVDTGIHFLFTHLLKDYCFEGMCNPPGGDWSGFSIIHNNMEARWLSLPRVSKSIDGKRPDHIIELFKILDKPVLLSIESKERSGNLESDVGTRLISYIRNLMNFVPNVTRQLDPSQEWSSENSRIPFNDYYTISAAAYLRKPHQANARNVFAKTNCDMLFIMEPIESGWDIEIITQAEKANKVKEFLISKLSSDPAGGITLH